MLELAFKGKIVERRGIEGADRIELATAVCGIGGKWRGVVPKGDFENVYVFLPDAELPQTEQFEFMRKYKFRVSQKKFKGVPSECLMLEAPTGEFKVGENITEEFGITKYIKPSTGFNGGEAIGDFPSFIPKTDEPNGQKVPWMLEALVGRPYMITLKIDGSSLTAYKKDDVPHVCSRNLELKDTPSSTYWRVARNEKLLDELKNGEAVQCEMCGPGIQKNRVGFSEKRGLIFDVYNFQTQQYVPRSEWPTYSMMKAELLKVGNKFNMTLDDLQDFAAQEKYALTGKPAEGIVVRATDNNGKCIDPFGYEVRLSFKIINLLYKD